MVLKGAFLGFLVLGFVPLAKAEMAVFETSKGSATVVNVEISTNSGSVRVDSPTAAPKRNLVNRFSIEVWNDDGADDLHCAFDANVSTVSTNALYGRRVPPRTSWTVAIPDSIPVHCRVAGSGAAAAAIAVITQLY